jgi:hypothetical protein
MQFKHVTPFKMEYGSFLFIAGLLGLVAVVPAPEPDIEERKMVR